MPRQSPISYAFASSSDDAKSPLSATITCLPPNTKTYSYPSGPNRPEYVHTCEKGEKNTKARNNSTKQHDTSGNGGDYL